MNRDSALDQDLYPDVAQMLAERRELFRLAAERMLEGGTSDPYALEWARRVVATCKPLNRPLGTGEPN